MGNIVGRPRVVVSVTASVDGRVALRRGEPLMGEAASQVWQGMLPGSAAGLEDVRTAELAERWGPQAVLEGSGSFVADSAEAVAGHPEEYDESIDELRSNFLPVEIVGRASREKWFTVVDSRGRIAWDIKSQGEYDVLVLVSRTTPPAHLAYLRRERIAYLVAGEDKVDLAAALRTMYEVLGVTCVVSTAGGGLNGELLRADLVDEIHLVISPAIIGGLGTPTAFDGPELPLDQLPTRLRLLSTQTETDGMIWLGYEVVREETEGA
ncbi:RibD family protein [Kribbella sp. DT2]|uniref:RibD family protein n=1 Tax=Kribbella sp. DT2 TaxID=3393427 RepID=UPI003CE6F3B3